jgi:DnaJ family protein C protein 8
MEASEEDIKRMYRMFSMILHPDKCRDSRAADSFQIVDQSYKTLVDPEKRKVYIRVMREAREKAEYDRNKENKRRAKFGQGPLPGRIFQSYFQPTLSKPITKRHVRIPQ